jgi:hypothetical protein
MRISYQREKGYFNAAITRRAGHDLRIRSEKEISLMTKGLRRYYSIHTVRLNGQSQQTEEYKVHCEQNGVFYQYDSRSLTESART